MHALSSNHEIRRTFAIISHPDAGKTTLTEKLLYFGGAIRMAGQVKARGEKRRAKSDWMKIEQERGISVTSSVMTFEHHGLIFNLLDTPGHEDFSEDTYRTLTAVDSAIMVIDASKGIETQTRKLFEVCRLRDIPIITLINKCDREAKDPFELLDEIQEALALDVSPMVLPIGSGSNFHGCYNVTNGDYYTAKTRGEAFDTVVETSDINDSKLDAIVDPQLLEESREMIELAQIGYSDFDLESYREGHLSPVIFGSALKDFGPTALLDLIAEIAPMPRPSPTTARVVTPDEKKVSGFVFKVQANMNSNHRDRVAFMRVCSGHFKRGMKLRQVRTSKDVMVHSPIMFFAQDREIAQEAGPGDVIGIPNHGTIRVGDTFTEGENIQFTGLPAFAPEILRRVRLFDTSKVKQLRRALEDLAEEGLTQVFKPNIGSNWIIGLVGDLQLDVLKSRAKAEYGVEIDFEPLSYNLAVWVRCDDEAKLKSFISANAATVVHDREGSPVFLAKSQWDLDYTKERNPDITFMKTRELVRAETS
ncbi:peptide chain release factor 3 [Cohaesibacter celericrescens]|uniref:Peptide chain release factor 3 n=1 Tax=Cohaesibacter celericrescens TaxID=2067669 RepID=A0A2N5XM75_9HYPH|nr:peptide chain release factor 3 [Cohaesibacter celericrescens]PLW75592.1 peptide chain release factor 3 [Cohaesibacter celericrescens]